MAENIDQEKIRHIAKLARIGLTEAEVEKYAGQMQAIVDYMDILKEVETNEVEMTTQVTGLKNVLREDEVRDYSAADDLLNCSELAKLNHQIKVQDII